MSRFTTGPESLLGSQKVTMMPDNGESIQLNPFPHNAAF